jgi:hypothetical protein
MRALSSGQSFQRQRNERQGNESGESRLIHSPADHSPASILAIQERSVESQLPRLLALTNLKAIQWIKLNRASIEFTAIFSEAEE